MEKFYKQNIDSDIKQFNSNPEIGVDENASQSVSEKY